MNHQDQRLTRRVAATKRKSDDIPHHNKEDTVGRSYNNNAYPEEAERRRRRQQQGQGSYNRIEQRETGLFLLRRDRERIFFLVVAVLGAAFVIFAYYAFSVVSHNYYNQGQGQGQRQGQGQCSAAHDPATEEGASSAAASATKNEICHAEFV
jgi:hypothetical protein